jgi:uncharacterized protein YbjQ (UPF0145 family)
MQGLRGGLAIGETDLVSVGSVIGAGVFQISTLGWCDLAPNRTVRYEDRPGQSLRDAWSAVLARLGQHARDASADGVIGVTVRERWTPSGQLEIALSGTGYRLPSSPRLEKPFLSALSLRNFLSLLIGGWIPCGIAWGVGVEHVHGTQLSSVSSGVSFHNAEMAGPTLAVTGVRSQMRRDLLVSARGCRGEGLVAASMEVHHQSQMCGSRVREGRVVWGRALGTAITRFSDHALPFEVARNLTERLTDD